MISARTPKAFNVWLPEKVRPATIAGAAIGVLFTLVTSYLTAGLHRAQFEKAVNTWGRSAEILISKRDISSLDAVTEFLRHEYNSIQVIVRDGESGRALWSYPHGIDGGKYSDSVLATVRRVHINANSGLDAEIHIGWMDTMGVVAATGGIVALISLISVMGFVLVQRLSINRIVREVERVQEGGDSEILEISELVRARELAEKQKALAESRAALGALASQVAHDISSPLAALKVVTSDLSELPLETRELLIGVTDRIRKIADELLLERRQIEKFADMSALQLAPLVESAVAEKRLQYKSKEDLDIRLDCDAPVGVSSKVDAMEFQRVVSNLVNNAVEATIGREKGTVRVRLSSKDQKNVISIYDNGHGINEDVLAKLRTVGGTFGKSAGNGLGLTHARKNVNSWNGSLEIESELGKGTAIHIELPASS